MKMFYLLILSTVCSNKFWRPCMIVGSSHVFPVPFARKIFQSWSLHFDFKWTFSCRCNFQVSEKLFLHSSHWWFFFFTFDFFPPWTLKKWSFNSVLKVKQILQELHSMRSFRSWTLSCRCSLEVFLKVLLQMRHWNFSLVLHVVVSLEWKGTVSGSVMSWTIDRWLFCLY